MRNTSTGHEVSDAPWLDLHFRSACREYEESLREVGLQPGWAVLDAGCGGGNFLPLIGELVGAQGRIAALDLAPENLVRVGALVRDGHCPDIIETRHGSMLALPYAEATFDGVWCANVVQYLSQDEFAAAVAEFRRVLKPGGTLAIKEFDVTMLQFLPMDRGMLQRFVSARLASQVANGKMGTGTASHLPSYLRRFGLADIRRRGWLVERWAPVPDATRGFVAELLGYFASAAQTYDLAPDDRRAWRALGEHPAALLDDPDFCFREFFVLTVARNPGVPGGGE